MRCQNCGTGNPDTNQFCSTCGVPIQVHQASSTEPEDQPEYLPIIPRGIAPAFLENLKRTRETTISWAQSVSEEIEQDVQGTNIAIPANTLSRISRFVTEIQMKKHDLDGMDKRIRQVYRQIRPSTEQSSMVSRFAINKEMFEALEIWKDMSQQLDSILLKWEAKLRELQE